jgi:hypothetical protein
MYIENYGDITLKNHSTGDEAVLTLKERGWGDRGAYECSGYVKVN